MNTFLYELYSFLFYPNKKLKNEGIKWQYFIYAVLLYFFMSSLFVVLIKKLDEIFGLPPHKSFSFIHDNPWYVVLFLGIIVIPIVEELTFRLYLKFSPFNLGLSIGLISYYGISIVSKSGIYTINEQTALKLTVSIFILVVFYYFFSLHKVYTFLTIFWGKYFQFILCFSILFFAFIHIRNLGDITLKNLLLFPIIVFPQFILAILASYFRVKYGITQSILIHSIINLIPISIIAIAFAK